MFDDIINIKDRLFIIKQANLDDATILNSNYTVLMSEANTQPEKEQLVILKNITQLRIKELTNNA